MIYTWVTHRITVIELPPMADGFPIHHWATCSCGWEDRMPSGKRRTWLYESQALSMGYFHLPAASPEASEVMGRLGRP